MKRPEQMDRKCRGIDWAGCPALSCTGWRQPGGLWFPRLLYAEGGGIQPRCETRPPLAAVCHSQATPEGQSTGDRTRKKKKKKSDGTQLAKRILCSSGEQQRMLVPHQIMSVRL